jgi:hypothetical protein
MNTQTFLSIFLRKGETTSKTFVLDNSNRDIYIQRAKNGGHIIEPLIVSVVNDTTLLMLTKIGIYYEKDMTNVFVLYQDIISISIIPKPFRKFSTKIENFPNEIYITCENGEEYCFECEPRMPCMGLYNSIGFAVSKSRLLP